MLEIIENLGIRYYKKRNDRDLKRFIIIFINDKEKRRRTKERIEKILKNDRA